MYLINSRMALARDKHRAHRKKKLEDAKSSAVKLLQPTTATPEASKTREKIKVASKSRSALVQGEGRAMGMEID
jgi:large subunit ribosomal protein L24e